MDQEIIKRFDAKRSELLVVFKQKHPDQYLDIVKALITAITCHDDNDWRNPFNPDPERITEINHGDYQGSLFYVIAAKGCQPSDYWMTEVRYGSCSGCDSLQSIRDDGHDNDTPTDKQANDYLTLALHLAQRMVKYNPSE
jgi:hypothetical protein